MKTLNINLKIEAKKDFTPSMMKIFFPNNKLSEILKINYKNFTKDTFLLPYKVQKLSKKIRHNVKKV